MTGRHIITCATILLPGLGCGTDTQWPTEPPLEETLEAGLIDPPTVITAIPRHDGAVRPTAILKILFSTPMDIEPSGSALEVRCQGYEVAGGLAWDTTEKVLAFHPHTLLPTGPCQLEIATTARSQSGAHLTEPYGQAFVVFDADECKPGGC